MDKRNDVHTYNAELLKSTIDFDERTISLLCNKCEHDADVMKNQVNITLFNCLFIINLARQATRIDHVS
jgi:hypothetical protein